MVGNAIFMEPSPSVQIQNSQRLKMVDFKLRTILSSERFCGLCLGTADCVWSTQVIFEININGKVYRKIFKDIIDDIFHDVSSIPASSNICKQCTDKTLEAYIFRQKTKDAARTLDCYVNCLYNKTVSVQDKLDPFQNYSDKKCTIVLLTSYRCKRDTSMVNNKGKINHTVKCEDNTVNLSEKETIHLEFENESHENIKDNAKRNSVMTDWDFDDKLVYDDSDYVPDDIRDKCNSTPKKKIKIIRKKNDENIIPKSHEKNDCRQSEENVENYTKGSSDFSDSNLDGKLIYDDSDFAPDIIEDKSDTVPEKKMRKSQKQKIRVLNKDTKKVVTKVKPIKTDKNEYKCVDCNKVFSLYREWKTHSQDEHPQELTLTLTKVKTKRPSCEVCLKSFSSNKYLLMHYKAVHNKVKCTFCDATFEESKFQEHLKIDHNDCTHSCYYCDLVFHSEATLEDHVNSSHSCEGTNDINGEQCNMCLKYFNEEQLQSHPCRFKCLLCPVGQCLHQRYLLSFRDQVYEKSLNMKCPDCEYVCRKKEIFMEHANKEHLNYRSYTCIVCSENFFTISDYRSHMKSHYDKDIVDIEPKFVCEICYKEFDERKNLVWHKRKHKRAQERIKCTVCDKEMFESNLSMHMKIHEGVESHSFTCETCGKSFAFKVRLDQHKMTHSDPIPCTLCGQLIKPMSMYLHLRRHKIRLNPALKKKPPKKPHNKKCEYCDYKTYCKDLLEIHVNKEHLKVKPHACKECGASYMSKYYLNQHMRVHKEEKKFNCSICNKSLRHKIGLKKHMMLHTGERPHICEVCGEGYKTVTMLKYHMQKHSGKNEQCPLCGGMYYSIKHVRSHIKKCHWEFKDRKFDCKQVRGLTKEHYHIFQDRRKAIADDIYDYND